MFKKNKPSILDDKIKECEEKLKTLDPSTDEFAKTLKNLNELKDSKEKDLNGKRAASKSKRETLESVGKLFLQAGGICAGVFTSLAIYTFDISGNTSTSKIASFVQQTFLKDKLK